MDTHTHAHTSVRVWTTETQVRISKCCACSRHIPFPAKALGLWHPPAPPWWYASHNCAHGTCEV